MIPETVLWCDPSRLTGLAWLMNHGTRFFADEYEFIEAGDQVEATCALFGPVLALGWERYVILPGRPQDDAWHAIEMIGVIKRAGLKHGCQILSPGQPHDPDPRDRKLLTAMGIWPKGKKDAASAATHMVNWLNATHQLPPAWRAAMSEAVRTL